MENVRHICFDCLVRICYSSASVFILIHVTYKVWHYWYYVELFFLVMWFLYEILIRMESNVKILFSSNLFTYLYGSKTKIWSRPVWENPPIVLYLERNSSSHEPQEPCYRCSRHSSTWVSVFLCFVRLSVVGLRHFLSCAQRSAIYCLSRRRWHLGCWVLNSLSNSKLFSIFGPYVVRKTFLSKTNNRIIIFVSTHVSMPYNRTGRIKVL
jgi:hypothetical protein